MARTSTGKGKEPRSKNGATGAVFKPRGIQCIEWRDPGLYEALITALTTMMKAGGVVMLGTAQGGRGLVVTTWVEGERDKVYVGDTQETIDALDSLREVWEGMIDEE